MDVPGQLSEVVALPSDTELATQFASAYTFTAEGAVMVGSSLSITVIVKEDVTLLLDPSVAVYVTVVVPTGNTSPML